MAKCKNCTRLFKERDEEREKFGEVWCDKIFDSPDVEIERECIHYNTKTNADRIRSMSDEELADFIEMKQFFALANNGTDGEEYTLEWLRKEIE